MRTNRRAQERSYFPARPLEMGLIGSLEASALSQPMLRNNPSDGRIYFNSGESLECRTGYYPKSNRLEGTPCQVSQTLYALVCIGSTVHIRFLKLWLKDLQASGSRSEIPESF